MLSAQLARLVSAGRPRRVARITPPSVALPVGCLGHVTLRCHQPGQSGDRAAAAFQPGPRPSRPSLMTMIIQVPPVTLAALGLHDSCAL